ncbi:leucyl aminopeptidase [Clostridium swellfunianum]|uniref:leucyl aminopeptidase n=1 Tax=Clostridium swellfunianum TaxID=1367462 RepID=UPI0020302F1B|nr:leucyl aminopeptidase [Clostridium swellfunianum]MCM0647952.1 leucyl aminopeptidase [Clostridium swellfunianum]
MNIDLNNIKPQDAEAVIVPVLLDSDKLATKDTAELLNRLKTKGKIKGEHGEVFSTMTASQDIIFIGLGKEELLNGEKVRIASAKAVKKARELKAKSLYVQLINSDKLCYGTIVKAMVEGLRFGDYKFDRYKTDKKEHTDLDICLGGVSEDKLKETEEYIKEANNISNATIIARNLVNEPSNVLYPETLAEEALEYGKQFGFDVEVFDELQIDELKMDAFLSVAEGSNKAPRLIVMRYFGNEDNKSEILGLVGKGLTYDSGGYSIKPTDGMVTMKSDMGGAAAVIGAMSAIANQKLKINVVAVVAACENMISGGAYKPGDIIGSMAGKTIEVLNTDAEGRLTLADAVYYIVEKEKASRVIDLATLTGAALIALGTTTTAVVTNDDAFYKELEAASAKSDEKVWQLPAFEDYKKMLKSDIADLKNIGGRHAGTITAGLFIGEFVQSKPWLHLDIAGTAWTDADKDYFSKGGTGAGVRTLYYLAKNTAKK